MRKTWQTVLATTLFSMLVTTTAAPASAERLHTSATTGAALTSLDRHFTSAAREFHVPKELLMAIAYNQSRWQPIHEEEQDAEGHSSKSGGHGIMHLVDSTKRPGVSKAAKGLGVAADAIKHNPQQNIRAAAYLLAQTQTELKKPLNASLADWYEAVALFAGATEPQGAVLYADEVYHLLTEGVTMTTHDGGRMTLKGHQSLDPSLGQFAGVTEVTTASTDYPNAIWNPAYSGNYAVADRPTSHAIQNIIIHDIEGSYSSAINWFKDPAAQVSAHYIIRSSDGEITQMVREKDIAWHARSYNSRSIGLEHEGYANQTGWYTDAMYRSSAALVRAICEKYNLPMTRDTIVGHYELPANTHTDPGNYWDWNTFMSYVTGETKNYTVAMVDDSYSTATFYGPSKYWRSLTGYGIHNNIKYTLGNGLNLSNYAQWRPNLSTAGQYEVKVFIPNTYGTTTKANYQVFFNGGSKTVTVNQSLYPDQWVSLGVYPFGAGTTGYVQLGDNTGDTEKIAFDAIKFMAQ